MAKFDVVDLDLKKVSELELSDAPAQAPSADAPLVELFVKTVSGDIRLERALAAVELTEQQ